MNTKLILASSAVLLAILGLILIFFPGEIALLFSMQVILPFQWFLQLMGALYFAFAMVNWMAKGAAIGGIYNKPVAIGNFTHFTIGALSLVKGVAAETQVHIVVWILAALYCLFAILFGIIFFGKGLPPK